MTEESSQDNIRKDQRGYYAYAYLNLTDANYRSAIDGFRYTLRNNIEPAKSVIGLICTYCCLGNYKKALSYYDEYNESIIFNNGLRHKLVNDLSYFLSKDVSALKLKRRNYLSSIRINYTMNRICEMHTGNPSNIVSMILLGYWLAYAGFSCEPTAEAARNCVYMKTLDDTFRWKLLGRLSVDDKSLSSDDDLAALFTEIPEEVSSTDYVNTLIISKLFKGDLESARNSIEIYRNKGHIFTNEVMWNFVKLSVDEDETDDLTVNFAKHLISEGWVDSYIAEVIRFGYANRSRYSVRREMNILEYYGL